MQVCIGTEPFESSVHTFLIVFRQLIKTIVKILSLYVNTLPVFNPRSSYSYFFSCYCYQGNHRKASTAVTGEQPFCGELPAPGSQAGV